MITFDEFLQVDMRVGQIIAVEPNVKARQPAYLLRIDFGEEIGVKQSSAQLCDFYTEADLMHKWIIAVVNFPPKKVAGFTSEVLVLAAVNAEHQAVLITPDQPVQKGQRIL